MYEYNYKGNKLNMSEMMKISKFYEVACTAEYLMDNFGIEDKDEALKKGYEVREIMVKYGMNEDEAIVEFFKRFFGAEVL